PVFIFILPGLFASTLAKKGLLIAPADSKGIYTVMITQLVPPGLAGIIIAALLSGLMSQVSGALNSISTLVSFDLYKRFKPSASDQQLVRMGRISAGIALLLSICLLPLLNSYNSIFNGVNDIISHIAPPITCVFLSGIFWSRASARAAQLTLLIGSLLGAFVYTINKLYPATSFAQIPFMMMAFYLFIICCIIQVSFSFVYPMQHTAVSATLYWKSPLEPLKNKGSYKVLSILLLLVMAILYSIFK
ncbi:MAG: sodium:solute symporter, partial [Bacteroidetes bacterium]|nr:sodium:solute symporter [Bacteroidota bacterium]